MTRTALVHHWLVTMRGGERVLEAIAALFPSADLFALVCDRSQLSESLRSRKIQSSLLQAIPRATRWYPYYLPLFPFATRLLDLSSYDLVISSDAATVKGVRCGKAVHICYCHTPMRCVWQGYETYRATAGRLQRRALGMVRNGLCEWDYEAAQRVTHFVANSRNVQKRIRECYGRDSRVIYPPVDTNRFFIDPERRRDSTFLVVSQLVPYKRIDLLVDAFTRCGRPLTVIGDGPERRPLQARAGNNVRFLGRQSDAEVVRAMQSCRAFIFSGEEDFGIVMAEAQACGTPVIALGRGGATEIVTPGESGILFQEECTDAVIDAVERFEETRLHPETIRRSAERFSRKRFVQEFSDLVRETAAAFPSR